MAEGYIGGLSEAPRKIAKVCQDHSGDKEFEYMKKFLAKDGNKLKSAAAMEPDNQLLKPFNIHLDLDVRSPKNFKSRRVTNFLASNANRVVRLTICRWNIPYSET